MIIRPISKAFPMDVNFDICKPKYADVLLLDKIGLRIPTEILNREKAHEFHKDKPVTILIQNQDVSEICIHDQWEPMVPNHWDRIKLVFQYLLKNKVLKSLPSSLQLVELEIAIDIYGMIPEIIFRTPSFKQYRNTETFYLRGFCRKMRRSEYGKMWTKSVQKSWIKYYNKAAQLNFYYPYYRFEFRFQGKYKNQLSFKFLNGDTYDVLNNYYAVIVDNARNLISYGDIAITKSTLSRLSPVFKQLLLAIGAQIIEK